MASRAELIFIPSKNEHFWNTSSSNVSNILHAKKTLNQPNIIDVELAQK